MKKRSPNWLRVVVAATVVALLAATPSIAARVADFARNAGKVDHLDASDLVRASSAIAGGHRSDFNSRGFATVQHARVEAPVRGVLLVWAGLSAEWDDDSDPGTYSELVGRIRVDRKKAVAPQRIEISRETRAGTKHMALSGATPVSKGPHKVELQIRSAKGDAFTYIHQRHIETLFVPFGKSGEQGSL